MSLNYQLIRVFLNFLLVSHKQNKQEYLINKDPDSCCVIYNKLISFSTFDFLFVE